MNKPSTEIVKKFSRQNVTEWVDGNPVSKIKEVITKEELEQIPKNILTEQYDGEDNRYKGKIKAEVLWHSLINTALTGNIEAIEKVFNRLLGRPVQQNLNQNVTMTYAEALKHLWEKQNEEEHKIE